MNIHLIKIKTIHLFVQKHAASAAAFAEWVRHIQCADWNIPNDIKETFNSADLLGKGSDRVIFNIGGNQYRMICFYYFGIKEVHLFVKWIGTHAEYDKLNKSGQQYTIDMY